MWRGGEGGREGGRGGRREEGGKNKEGRSIIEEYGGVETREREWEREKRGF